MSYRLLALDLDGTLLDRRGKVAAADRAAIAALQASGVIVTIVTGRLAAGATDAAAQCEILGPIGCCDGSHLYDTAEQRTLAQHELSQEGWQVLDDALQRASLARYVFSTDRVFCDSAGGRYAEYVRTWAPRLADLRDLRRDAPAWTEHAALAQLMLGEPEEIAGVAEAVAGEPSLYGVQFAVSEAVSGATPARALLVRARGPSKGTALAELCARHGVPLAQAVAVGDWWNDVPMFEVAGRSFAMPIAPEDVKRAASDQLDGEASSIADAIAVCWPGLS